MGSSQGNSGTTDNRRMAELASALEYHSRKAATAARMLNRRAKEALNAVKYDQDEKNQPQEVQGHGDVLAEDNQRDGRAEG